MLPKHLLLLLLFVYSVVSLNTFIEKGQRAEFFELTDNKVTTFKVNLPKEEFAILKKKAVYGFVDSNVNLEELIGQYQNIIAYVIYSLPEINFFYFYPNYDFDKIIPELNIGEDGYPKINPDELIYNFDFNPEHYRELYENNRSVLHLEIFKSNPDFNLYEICKTIKSLKFSEDIDPMIKLDFRMLLSYININEIKNINYNEVHNVDYIYDDTPFKTKNATLSVEINGEIKNFKKVTFKLGGKTSRFLSKPMFNLKIRGDNDLYGRSYFKLRSDCTDPSFLRTKLVSDIHNRLGLQSISSNYITLYINDEYMGLYILNDSIKPSWVEQVYNETSVTSLYKCDNLYDFDPQYSMGCVNENEDINDDTEWIQFLDSVKNAKSVSDLENIFEIDQFLTEMAVEYLLGSYDHFHNSFQSHNFYMYKQKNGKWIYLTYDFDADFGSLDCKVEVPFEEYTKQSNIIDILILKNPEHFEKILKEVVNKVFNPNTLYPYIDELKKLIKSYVELDRTPDSNGNCPGRLNTLGTDLYSFEDWNPSTEFTYIETDIINTYGLKYWILNKYRYVCNYYNMECDPTYMDENYKYPENNSTNTVTSTITETTILLPTATSIIEPTSSTITENRKCWSEFLGYSCCSPEITAIYERDEYGDWSYDFTKNEWCGLTVYEEPISNNTCWSEKLGYSCCKSCKVYEIDIDGSWGYESNQWCGIPEYCQK